MLSKIAFLCLSLIAAIPSRAAEDTAGSAACQGLERQALALGVGVHDLYDATDGSVRTFSVTREPRTSGGHRYEVHETTPGRSAAGFFSQADDYYRMQGKARAAMQVALPYLASNYEHANDSVFDLFRDIMAGSNNFGMWLANYMKAQGIPVMAPRDLKQLLKLQEEHVGIRYGSDLSRQSVRVVFADGEAEFALSKAEDMYRYEAGTALDLDGHAVPENPVDAIAHGEYEFSGGAQSASYRGFLKLVEAWQFPSLGIRYDWRCAPAAQGVQRCRLADMPPQTEAEQP